MLAVHGVYEGGNTVRINESELGVIEQPCDVVVSFLENGKNEEEKQRFEDEKKLVERRKVFEGLIKFHKTLRADFDYQKELVEWRDGHYACID